MSVTAAEGFRAAGAACGIKADGSPDLALLVADEAVPVAAVFTTSLTPAPPVVLSRARVAGGRARAVVTNSGCANAGTGSAGLDDATRMGAVVAAQLDCPDSEVLVCSTGPIGGRIPIDRIEMAVPDLVRRLDDTGGSDAARGILTTDTVTKEAVAVDSSITVGGMAKGAGMLRPDMATMLAFLTTDGEADPALLAGVLGEATAVTFNCLDVDGCQSTNDTVILMASGRAGPVDGDRLGSMVEEVCRELARAMAEDAEGASRVVDLIVSGAENDADARRIGRTVADSALVRSSFWGADPNWGRVLAAVGVAGVGVEPEDIRISYQGVVVCDGGVAAPFDEQAVIDQMGGNFAVEIEVGSGAGGAAIVTTDLTPDYVRFNGERS